MWQTWSHKVVSNTPRHETGFELTTLVVIGTDCIGSFVNPTTIRSQLPWRMIDSREVLTSNAKQHPNKRLHFYNLPIHISYAPHWCGYRHNKLWIYRRETMGQLQKRCTCLTTFVTYKMYDNMFNDWIWWGIICVLHDHIHTCVIVMQWFYKKNNVWLVNVRHATFFSDIGTMLKQYVSHPNVILGRPNNCNS